jgi:hypothetical protein
MNYFKEISYIQDIFERSPFYLQKKDFYVNINVLKKL